MIDTEFKFTDSRAFITGQWWWWSLLEHTGSKIVALELQADKACLARVSAVVLSYRLTLYIFYRLWHAQLAKSWVKYLILQYGGLVWSASWRAYLIHVYWYMCINFNLYVLEWNRMKFSLIPLQSTSTHMDWDEYMRIHDQLLLYSSHRQRPAS